MTTSSTRSRFRVGHLLVLACALLLSACSTNTTGSDLSSAADFPATISGDALNAWDQTQDITALGGTQAPVVTAQSFDHSEVVVGKPGKPQAIMFAAHWCGHCQNEVPLVKDFAPTVEGIDIVGVSTFHNEARPNWPPNEWYEREAFPAPVAVDAEGKIADSYGIVSVPAWVFLDADGKVVARYVGAVSGEQFQALAGVATGEFVINDDGEVAPGS